eukprot:gb/GECH01009667.1/.p1 GENE.gb/GECH01009667.1/~~gb/GECH01009667.1/.p1  ORF type:complete len:167 (+),score=6.61 gb/GECH01009667.1/:1-501(+)
MQRKQNLYGLIFCRQYAIDLDRCEKHLRMTQQAIGEHTINTHDNNHNRYCLSYNVEHSSFCTPTCILITSALFLSFIYILSSKLLTFIKLRYEWKMKGFGRCIICYSDNANHVMMPCGHLCICSRCIPRFTKRCCFSCVGPSRRCDKRLCPVCRYPIESCVRVFTL